MSESDFSPEPEDFEDYAEWGEGLDLGKLREKVDELSSPAEGVDVDELKMPGSPLHAIAAYAHELANRDEYAHGMVQTAETPEQEERARETFRKVQTAWKVEILLDRIRAELGYVKKTARDVDPEVVIGFSGQSKPVSECSVGELLAVHRSRKMVFRATQQIRGGHPGYSKGSTYTEKRPLANFQQLKKLARHLADETGEPVENVLYFLVEETNVNRGWYGPRYDHLK